MSASAPTKKQGRRRAVPHSASAGTFNPLAGIEPPVRLRVAIRGVVQGVGFRPFVYRLATELGLAGWVSNSAQGVGVEVEGRPASAEAFLLRLEAEKPRHSSIQGLEATWLEAEGHVGFEIRASNEAGAKTALVLPDIASCVDCLREVFDPANRRYRYPFTNCTYCGPRFSIIEALPYDRPNTTMKGFVMCAECRAEYEDPGDRRFHAQPNACPVCGPHLELWDHTGNRLAAHDAALRGAAAAIRRGEIVAVKGLGGFHLMTAAHDDTAVQRLRERKQREEKPLALMFPSLAKAQEVCEVSELEARLLRSPEAPIVLLKRRRGGVQLPRSKGNQHSITPTLPHAVSASVAPGNPCLGVMLPYTPLHHLLLRELGFPVVATSGNRSDEPICTEEHDALARLGGIADLFLVHNRPIVRHVDDSIARVVLGRELVLRRARGYAPLPIPMQAAAGSHPTEPVLAVGAHLKNTIALSVGDQVFISQHIGDLETAPAFAAFGRVIADFQRLYEARPQIVAADLHPDYLSTKFARESGLHTVTVQHHLAHVVSCMAENELQPPVLGVSWDGTGLGTDGTIWGGEFLLVGQEGFERVGHFRPFASPGGDRAVKEPRRTALGLLHEVFGDAALEMADLPPVRAFSATELAALRTMLQRNLNAPRTSSVGRLFDAVAALVGLRQRVCFEGQAAMELEFAADRAETEENYALPVEAAGPAAVRASGGAPHLPLLVEWSPMIQEIIADFRRRLDIARIAARFHNSLVEATVAVARRVGEPRIALSGGCFQNQYLLERTVRRLRQEGFWPCWHQRVPPNDGGIALGQIVAARCLPHWRESFAALSPARREGSPATG